MADQDLRESRPVVEEASAATLGDGAAAFIDYYSCRPQCDRSPMADDAEVFLRALLASHFRMLAALKDVVASASPHPVEHRAMYAAWVNARAAIAKAEAK